MVSFDFVQMLWSISYLSPVMITYLLSALVLYMKRRTAPRACIIGMRVMLALFISIFVLLAINLWLILQLSNQTDISQSTALFLMNLNRLISSFLNASCVGLLIWCILMGRKPVAVADE